MPLSIHLAHTHLATTHSTNSQLIDSITQAFNGRNGELTTKKQPRFSQPQLLTADTQTSGRGQYDRTWQSPLGNVYLSLYIPNAQFAIATEYHLSQRLDGRLSLCVGYQLSQLPQIKPFQQIGVKWVNDIGFYDGHQFNKLAGILIEPVSVDNTMLGVVVGVGMNIATAPTLTKLTQENLSYKAVSLQDLTGNNLNPHDFYQPISQAILQAILQFNGFGEPIKVAEFLQDFSQRDKLRGKKLQVTLANNDQLFGTAYGIDSNGCLQILEDDGTLQAIWTGKIQVI